MKISPRTIVKATSLVVAPRRDGSYDVAGVTATYRVFVRINNALESLFCDCLAGRTGSRCSHKLAVVFYRQRIQKAAI